MPNLIGKTEEQAKKILTDNKLVYGSTSYIDNAVIYGVVLVQSIAANSQVSEGTTVNLTLSSGKVAPIKPSNSPTKTLTIILPQDKPTVNVKIVLTGISKGEKTIAFQKTCNSIDSPITAKIGGLGKEHLQVFFDNQLSQEDDINFGEARIDCPKA